MMIQQGMSPKLKAKFNWEKNMVYVDYVENGRNKNKRERVYFLKYIRKIYVKI